MKAFPNTAEYPLRNDGMDLRDYFASKASDYDIYPYMFEVTVNGPCRSEVPIRTREEAKYVYADAMLKAREA